MGAPHYTDEQIDTALIALVLTGSSKEAVKHLRALPDYPRLGDRTLRGWQTKHADRLERLERELAPRVANRVAARAESIALRSLEVQAELVEQTHDKRAGLDADKASAAARNLAVVTGIAFDKLSGPIRGRPNVIIERRDPAEILRRIEQIAGTQHALDPPPATEPGVSD